MASGATLGRAYVQIMPSSKGISGSIQKVLDPEAKASGTSAGNKIGLGLKVGVAAAAAAVTAIIAKSVGEGAKLEQSIGGIETLFKDNANTVRKYADEAYKTVGVSANEYMENVTSFSASLLQSLGGDTEKAAKVADRAMIDMGDNANKMGTSMGDIQNAYQGFAKQNYTMLDNLKLGYGGTKTEMQRLLKDAKALTGIEYNIDNLADVYTAVGVIQEQLDITGTTALEAQETLSGSLNAMKSSFTNTLGKLALGEDIKPSLEALSTTLSTFLFGNLLPMIGNIVSALPSGLIMFLTEAIPALIKAGGDMINSLIVGITKSTPGFLLSINKMILDAMAFIKDSLPLMLKNGVDYITNFVNGLLNSLPSVISSVGEILDNMLKMIFDFVPVILDSGFQLISNMAKGVLNNMPEIISSIVGVLDRLLKTIIEKYPEYFKKGWEIVGKIATGIWNNLPEIITTISNLIASLLKTIGSNLPQFLAAGLKIIVDLGVGIIKAIPGLVAKIPQLISALLKSMSSLAGSFSSIGVDLIKGLWNGIASVQQWILNKISGFVGNVMSGIKGFFGIKSPSKRMADEIGEFLPSGIALGIEANTKPLTKTMADLSDLTLSSFDSHLSFDALKFGEQGQIGIAEARTNNTVINNEYVLAGTYHIREEADIQKVIQGMSREIERMGNR